MNDPHLQAAFPLVAEPPTLDAKIDRALARVSRVRRTRRRLVLGFATTAGIALAFVAGPAVQAQASLGGIVRALDKQTRVRIVTYTVAPDGARYASATTTIANGDTAYVDGNGTRQVYDVGTKTYALDASLGRFVVTPRRPSRSIRLSDMLGPAGEFSMDKRATVQREDGVIRATIENRGLPERYVIDADPKTDLPIRMRVEGRELGEWRTVSELAFDYAAPIAAIAPDLRRYPAITPEDAAEAFERAMTDATLAQVPLKRGRLVVRRLDVAQDGTVFVAYQSGGDVAARSWNGYAVDLADDLGTRYVRLGDMSDSPENARSKEGAIQLETFVPVTPLPPGRARTLRLATHLWSSGKLARSITAGINYPDGHTEWHEQLNSFGKDANGREVPLLARRFAAPTCGVMPAWSAKLSMTMGNEPWAEMAKADARARLAMLERRWPEAEAQIDRRLAMIEAGERQGYGPYSRSGALEDRDLVQAALRGERVREPKDAIALSATGGFDAAGRRQPSQ